MIVCAAGLSWACSTVDRGPIDECEVDADCGLQFVCSLGETNTCVPESLPPLTALGFAIRDGVVDGSFDIELRGCDPEVQRELGGSALRIQKRGSMIRTLSIDATHTRTVASCDDSDCTGVCDPSALTCTESVDRQLDLGMSSRLFLQDLTTAASTYMSMPAEGELPTPLTFTVPSYETEEAVDPLAHAALRLQIAPIGLPAESKLGRYVRVIAEDAGDTLTTNSWAKCQRAIIGPEGTVRTVGNVPVVDATVEFVFDEPIATPATVIGNGRACSTTDECPPGWACNGSSCGLDMTGMPAGTAIRPEEPSLTGALPHTYLYTYCEGVEDGEPLTRAFQVRVTPQLDTGLPVVTLALEQEFPDVLPLIEVNVAKSLCLPDWQPPKPISFSVVGEPVTLAETELGTYRCCSTECLPSTEVGVEPTPPPSVDSCSNFDKIRFETRWYILDQIDPWSFAGCTLPGTNSDGSNGRYARDGACTDEGCSASLTMGELDDETRLYTVTINQPVGSVFRSQRLSVSLTNETDELPTFELQPRVLLRGQIVCTESSCNAQNAVVAAERLRTETDDNDVPAPYFFEARADANGDFLLPIDPGVYVMTAFPEIGQPGGPAKFSIVDLREDSPLVTVEGGVPQATLPEPFELDDGVLVRVQLRDFPVSTAVVPLDIGSWRYQGDFQEGIDLNDPDTCLGSSTRGCDIRRIRPTDAPISLQISGQFQFTARDRGEASCN